MPLYGAAMLRNELRFTEALLEASAGRASEPAQHKTAPVEQAAP